MERSASDISDVRRYLLNDFSFRSRCHVLRNFKLYCLVVGEPHREYPSFSVNLSGCGLRRTCLQLCLRSVQTHILSADYCHQSFFTEHTLALNRSAISTAGVFFIGTDFNVWADLSGPGVDSFIDSFCRFFYDFLEERRRAGGEYYTECNRLNRLAQVDQGSRTSSVVRSTSSSAGKEKDEVASTTSTKRSSKSVEKGECSSKGKTPKASQKKKNPQPQDKDLEVFHKLKKVAKN